MITLHFVGFHFYTAWWGNTLVQLQGAEDGVALLNLINIITFPVTLLIWVAAFFEFEKFENMPSVAKIMKNYYGSLAGIITWMLVFTFGCMMIIKKIEMIIHFTESGKKYLTFTRQGLDIFFQLVKMGSFALEFPLLLAYMFATADMVNLLIPKKQNPWISEQARISIIAGLIALLTISVKISSWWYDAQIIQSFYLYFFSLLTVPFLAILWGFKVNRQSFYVSISIFLTIFLGALLVAYIKEDSLLATSLVNFKQGKPSALLQFAKLGSIWGNVAAFLGFLIHHYLVNDGILTVELR
ncbi:MAG: hypothetical protein AAF770_03110 [Bacteroidota bacterium]